MRTPTLNISNCAVAWTIQNGQLAFAASTTALLAQALALTTLSVLAHTLPSLALAAPKHQCAFAFQPSPRQLKRAAVNDLSAKTKATARLALNAILAPHSKAEPLIARLKSEPAFAFDLSVRDGFPILWSNAHFELIGFNRTFVEGNTTTRENALFSLHQYAPQFLHAHGYHLTAITDSGPERAPTIGPELIQFTSPALGSNYVVYLLLRPKAAERERRTQAVQELLGLSARNALSFQSVDAGTGSLSIDERVEYLSARVIPEASSHRRRKTAHLLSLNQEFARHDFLVHRFESLVLMALYLPEVLTLAELWKSVSERNLIDLSDPAAVESEVQPARHELSFRSLPQRIAFRARLETAIYALIHDVPALLSGSSQVGPTEDSSAVLRTRIDAMLASAGQKLSSWQLFTRRQGFIISDLQPGAIGWTVSESDSIGFGADTSVQLTWVTSSRPSMTADWQQRAQNFIDLFVDGKASGLAADR